MPELSAYEKQVQDNPKASTHFSFAELTRTSTGLPNIPNEMEIASLVRLAENCLEPMRSLVGPLRVTSGFRCPAVNTRVGGVKPYHGRRGSQHLYGEAADISPILVSPTVLYNKTRESNIQFDQLILEPGWVHVSTPPLGKPPRLQCLKATLGTDGKMKYVEVANGSTSGSVQ